MNYKIVLPVLAVFGLFLHGSRSGFSRIGSGFLADPDPEKTRIRNTAEYVTRLVKSFSGDPVGSI